MGTLSLVTFNTHYGLEGPRRGARPYDLEAVLADLAADVMVIQEVWRPDGHHGVVDAFARGSGYALHHVATGRATDTGRWPHHDPSGRGTVGTAVLTRVPAAPLPSLAVGPTLGDPAPARTLPQVEVRLDGDRPLRVVGVHLTSRLPHGPVLQLRRLVGDLPPPGTPTVVVGDCNFWGPPTLAVLRDGWRRGVTGRTWPAVRPHSQIDHVFVRPADVAVTRPAVLDACGSDHRPVRVRLDW
jgi:endonuclease/exonuclease/phosphatase family metal-dependent hydrolase